jgi:hypothetical protein
MSDSTNEVNSRTPPRTPTITRLAGRKPARFYFNDLPQKNLRSKNKKSGLCLLVLALSLRQGQPDAKGRASWFSRRDVDLAPVVAYDPVSDGKP